MAKIEQIRTMVMDEKGSKKEEVYYGKKFDIDQGFHQLDEILTKLSSEEIKLQRLSNHIY